MQLNCGVSSNVIVLICTGDVPPEKEPAVPRDQRKVELQLREALPVPGAQTGRVRCFSRSGRIDSYFCKRAAGEGLPYAAAVPDVCCSSS